MERVNISQLPGIVLSRAFRISRFLAKARPECDFK